MAKNVLKERMVENFQNLMEDTHLQIQDTEQTLNMIFPKKSNYKEITIKLLRTKDKIKIL